jgi:NAD(P)-dependent dehydrogenase (short-subunit alcohol dehydrogenase family)
MNLQDLIQLYDFSGKTAVVTGGSGVLGREMVRALLGCGASVAVLSRNPDPAAGIFQTGSETLQVVRADVLQPDTLHEAAAQIESAFGPVHMLINAAGGNHADATTSKDRTFFDLPREGLDYVFNLNLMGTMLPCQVFGRGMAARGEGVILNVSSMSAFTPLTRISGYSAAKSAVNSFTQWLAVHMAQEYSPDIRVNAIAPGFFLTEQNRFLLTDEQSGSLTARGNKIIEHTPMGRFGTPEDLIGAVLWLLSPASAFVTGTVVPVDGGFSAFSGV